MQKDEEGESTEPKAKEKQTKQEQQRVMGLLYDFPQRAFLLLLFGLLAIVGSIVTLACGKYAVFMQILGWVGASCGIGMGITGTVNAVKHIINTKNSLDKPLTD